MCVYVCAHASVHRCVYMCALAHMPVHGCMYMCALARICVRVCTGVHSLVSARVHVCTCVHLHMCTCAHLCIVYMCVRVCTCVRVFVHVCARAVCTCMCMCARMRMCTGVYMCALTHLYTCTCVWVCTHASVCMCVRVSALVQHLYMCVHVFPSFLPLGFAPLLLPCGPTMVPRLSFQVHGPGTWSHLCDGHTPRPVHIQRGWGQPTRPLQAARGPEHRCLAHEVPPPPHHGEVIARATGSGDTRGPVTDPTPLGGVADHRVIPFPRPSSADSPPAEWCSGGGFLGGWTPPAHFCGRSCHVVVCSPLRSPCWLTSRVHFRGALFSAVPSPGG